MKNFYVLLSVLFLLCSCDQILLESDISNETVNLVAPADNAQFYSTGITFTWDPVENGTQYRIQIARPDFNNPLQIIADNVIDTTSFTTQLNVGSYQWRVQAVNSGYHSAYATRSLTVASNEDFQNNSVTLSLPANNTITNTAAQTLTWQPIIGATGYHVQVVDATGSTVVFEQDVEATTVNYTFLEGNYQWKVRATNGNQNTLYAMRTILVDITVPNTPQLTLPTNNTSISNSDISYEWARAAIQGSTEKDSLYIYTDSALTTLQYKNQQTSPYNTASLSEGTYYWFVRSFDEAGNTGQQSSVFTFTLN